MRWRCPIFSWPLVGVGMMLLVLGVGCAPKVVVLPPPAPPAPLAPSDRLFVVANSWIGVPYRLGGMDRSGVDCSGLAVNLYAEAFGTVLPRRSLDQVEVGIPVPPALRQPADLLFFWDRGPHMGVLLDSQRFIHASSGRGVMISELDAYWWSRLRMVRRILGAGY
jgi:cell wall-associated NlpC family hydrolase